MAFIPMKSGGGTNLYGLSTMLYCGVTSSEATYAFVGVYYDANGNVINQKATHLSFKVYPKSFTFDNMISVLISAPHTIRITFLGNGRYKLGNSNTWVNFVNGDTLYSTTFYTYAQNNSPLVMEFYK